MEPGLWNRAWGAAACRRLIGSVARFDAVFCGNDQIALGAESVLRESGRRVPDAVAPVGVDNWEHVISGRSTRRLTTVDTGLAATPPEHMPTRAHWWSARRRPEG
ncbi:substrate-binding domain-containing protein [Streptomyces sp. NPDC004728]|uniref:substrate-binding domain-containing protein n=1 Tax=Streptomyces sp. NPDC004728 TaxID=3154289 RepID=UPI0033A4E411